MAPRFPSIPEPGNDPATQLNTLRVIKQVVELLAANATGDKNASGPGQGAQIFALQEDVKRLIQQEAASRAQADDGNKKDITWTVDEAVADLNKDISDARNRAIQARADALQALDEFENGTFLQTVYDINQEIGDAKGQISEKYGLSVEADKVQSGRISKAAAYVGLNEASWKEGDLSVADRFKAMSTGYKSYVARTGDDFLASYTSHVVTTTDFTSAITTKLDQLEAKLTVPGTPGRNPTLLSSAIITESNLTTDATKKIATAQNLQTTIASLTDVEGKNGATTNGAITAAVKVESDARVKLVNGADGKLDKQIDNILSTAAYSVVVNTTGSAGPAITGFRAVSDSSSATPISDFQIFADKFRVTSGSTSKQVFAVDTATQNVQIAGDLVVTGSISSGAISNTKGSQYSTAGTVQTSVYIRKNARVLVLVSSQGETFTSSSTVSGVFATDASVTSSDYSVTYAYNRVTNNVSFSQLPINSTHLEYQYNPLTKQWQWVAVTTTTIAYTYFVGAATNNLYWINDTGVDAYFSFNMAYYSNSVVKPCQVSLLVLELAR